MTEQSGLDVRNPKGQEDSAASGSSLADVNAFRGNAGTIATVLNALREPDQAPDMLETVVPLSITLLIIKRMAYLVTQADIFTDRRNVPEDGAEDRWTAA